MALFNRENNSDKKEVGLRGKRTIKVQNTHHNARICGSLQMMYNNQNNANVEPHATPPSAVFKTVLRTLCTHRNWYDLHTKKRTKKTMWQF